MPEREFSSPDGRRWRVWEVHPRDIVGERRADVERRVTPVESLDDPPALERRRTAERRTGRTHSRATLLPRPWQDGWIVFEEQPVHDRRSARPEHAEHRNVPESRRLAPIPNGWTSCSEAELTRHLEQAIAAREHHHGPS